MFNVHCLGFALKKEYTITCHTTISKKGSQSSKVTSTPLSVSSPPRHVFAFGSAEISEVTSQQKPKMKKTGGSVSVSVPGAQLMTYGLNPGECLCRNLNRNENS